MTKKKSLFEEFSPATKTQWLDKALTDLKGKPLEDLKWQLAEDISIDPFYHADDQIGGTNIFRGDASNNNWAIGESFLVNEPIATNKTLLDALKNGLDAPCFTFPVLPSPQTFKALFLNVIPTYIQIHFKMIGNVQDYTSLIENYYRFLSTQGISSEQLQGSFQFVPDNSEEVIPIIKTTKRLFPAYKCICLDYSNQECNPNHITDYLKSFLIDADLLFQRIDADQVPFIQISISIGSSYFVEIAKIRAIRILWSNLLSAYGLQKTHLIIDAHIDSKAYDENENTNMIRSMTIAMSGVIGGIDRLTIRPASSDDSPFSNRIARNVQHLLKMESYMDRVIDPAAGSFYIEKLSKTFAEKAWEKFRA